MTIQIATPSCDLRNTDIPFAATKSHSECDFKSARATYKDKAAQYKKQWLYYVLDCQLFVDNVYSNPEQVAINGLKMSSKEPVIIDSQTGQVEAIPPQRHSRYRVKLDTLGDVRREMARLYRESRSGLLCSQDATKLTWCLQSIGKVIESSDLEKRIEALEAKQ